MTNSNINTLLVLINLLQQHSKIHILSVAFTASAVMLLILSIANQNDSYAIIVINLLVILVGLYETYGAIRVGFDIKLFNRLTLPDVNVQEQLKLIDSALLELKLMPNNKTERDLDVRMHGVKILFKKQAIACLVQLAGLLVIGYLYF